MDIGSIFKKLLGYVRSHPIFAAAWAVRNAVVFGSALLGLAYMGFSQSEAAAKELSTDFRTIAESQDKFLGNARELQTALLDPDEEVDLLHELVELREKASNSLTALANLRAPTSAIEDARYEYKSSLEELIGVSTFMLREGVDDQAIRLHNALQNASNSAGKLRGKIETFQGGAIPQALGGIF